MALALAWALGLALAWAQGQKPKKPRKNPKKQKKQCFGTIGGAGLVGPKDWFFCFFWCFRWFFGSGGLGTGLAGGGTWGFWETLGERGRPGGEDWTGLSWPGLVAG